MGIGLWLVLLVIHAETVEVLTRDEVKTYYEAHTTPSNTFQYFMYYISLSLSIILAIFPGGPVLAGTTMDFTGAKDDGGGEW